MAGVRGHLTPNCQSPWSLINWPGFRGRTSLNLSESKTCGSGLFTRTNSSRATDPNASSSGRSEACSTNARDFPRIRRLWSSGRGSGVRHGGYGSETLCLPLPHRFAQRGTAQSLSRARSGRNQSPHPKKRLTHDGRIPNWQTSLELRQRAPAGGPELCWWRPMNAPTIPLIFLIQLRPLSFVWSSKA